MHTGLAGMSVHRAEDRRRRLEGLGRQGKLLLLAFTGDLDGSRVATVRGGAWP